jgi:sugar phosphate isomerase/epimerase
LSEETILSDSQFLNELRSTEARTAPRYVGVPLAADRLSMSQMTTRHWNFEEDILGYRRFELSRVAVWHQKLALFGEEKALDLLAEHPVAVTSLYHGGGFLDADELRWGDPAADAIDGVRLAARLGARDVVVVSGDRGTFTKGHAKRLLVESLRRLADAAGESGVHVALAPLHRSQSRGRTFLTELEETIEVIDRTRHARLGLALDLLASWDDACFLTRVGELTPWVRVVTISDTASRKRGSGHQCVPGEGMVPLVDRLKSLCAAGYAGPIECRVLSSDRDATGYDELLARCLASFDRLCSDVNG